MDVPHDVAEWRTRRRAELLALRSSIAPEDRGDWNSTITRLLVEGFPCLGGMIVGFCWPFKGEFDARFAIRHFRDRGALAALPVVVAKGQPMQFRVWTPQTHTEPGVFGLPVPQGTPAVRPDALLIPPVGFSSRGYRLGYGGGYFDRTLAAMTPQPLKIGVAFEISRVHTIYPQPHDVPLDFIVTEKGIHEVRAERLVLIRDPAEVRKTVARMSLERSAVKAAESPARPMPLTGDELVAVLDELLDVGRASVRAIALYLDACEEDSPPWLQLRGLQRGEAKNCGALFELIRGLAATPADIATKALREAAATRGQDERLAFLVRCQRRMARLIRDALPRLDDPVIRPALKRMLASALVNADRYESLLRQHC